MNHTLHTLNYPSILTAILPLTYYRIVRVVRDFQMSSSQSSLMSSHFRVRLSTATCKKITNIHYSIDILCNKSPKAFICVFIYLVCQNLGSHLHLVQRVDEIFLCLTIMPTLKSDILSPVQWKTSRFSYEKYQQHIKFKLVSRYLFSFMVQWAEDLLHCLCTFCIWTLKFISFTPFIHFLKLSETLQN